MTQLPSQSPNSGGSPEKKRPSVLPLPDPSGIPDVLGPFSPPAELWSDRTFSDAPVGLPPHTPDIDSAYLDAPGSRFPYTQRENTSIVYACSDLLTAISALGPHMGRLISPFARDAQEMPRSSAASQPDRLGPGGDQNLLHTVARLAGKAYLPELSDLAPVSSSKNIESLRSEIVSGTLSPECVDSLLAFLSELEALSVNSQDSFTALYLRARIDAVKGALSEVSGIRGSNGAIYYFDTGFYAPGDLISPVDTGSDHETAQAYVTRTLGPEALDPLRLLADAISLSLRLPSGDEFALVWDSTLLAAEIAMSGDSTPPSPDSLRKRYAFELRGKKDSASRLFSTFQKISVIDFFSQLASVQSRIAGGDTLDGEALGRLRYAARVLLRAVENIDAGLLSAGGPSDMEKNAFSTSIQTIDALVSQLTSVISACDTVLPRRENPLALAPQSISPDQHRELITTGIWNIIPSGDRNPTTKKTLEGHLQNVLALYPDARENIYSALRNLAQTGDTAALHNPASMVMKFPSSSSRAKFFTSPFARAVEFFCEETSTPYTLQKIWEYYSEYFSRYYHDSSPIHPNLAVVLSCWSHLYSSYRPIDSPPGTPDSAHALASAVVTQIATRMKRFSLSDSDAALFPHILGPSPRQEDIIALLRNLECFTTGKQTLDMTEARREILETAEDLLSSLPPSDRLDPIRVGGVLAQYFPNLHRREIDLVLGPLLEHYPRFLFVAQRLLKNPTLPISTVCQRLLAEIGHPSPIGHAEIVKSSGGGKTSLVDTLQTLFPYAFLIRVPDANLLGKQGYKDVRQTEDWGTKLTHWVEETAAQFSRIFGRTISLADMIQLLNAIGYISIQIDEGQKTYKRAGKPRRSEFENIADRADIRSSMSPGETPVIGPPDQRGEKVTLGQLNNRILFFLITSGPDADTLGDFQHAARWTETGYPTTITDGQVRKALKTLLDPADLNRLTGGVIAGKPITLEVLAEIVRLHDVGGKPNPLNPIVRIKTAVANVLAKKLRLMGISVHPSLISVRAHRDVENEMITIVRDRFQADPDSGLRIFLGFTSNVENVCTFGVPVPGGQPSDRMDHPDIARFLENTTQEHVDRARRDGTTILFSLSPSLVIAGLDPNRYTLKRSEESARSARLFSP